MTNTEAIGMLAYIKAGRPEKEVEALDLAISALEGLTNPRYVIKVKTAADAKKIAEEWRRQAATGVVLPADFEVQRLDRPEGRWIKHNISNLDELGFVLCSNCRCGFKRYDRGTRKSELPWIDGQPYELENRCNYCPTCGAKMLNANGPTEEESHEDRPHRTI